MSIPLSGASFTKSHNFFHEVVEPRFLQCIAWMDYVACFTASKKSNSNIELFLFKTGNKKFYIFNSLNMTPLGTWNPEQAYQMRPFTYLNDLYVFQSLLGHGFGIYKLDLNLVQWEYIREYTMTRRPTVSVTVIDNKLLFTSQSYLLAGFVNEVDLNTFNIVKEHELGVAPDEEEVKTIVNVDGSAYIVSNTMTNQKVYKIEKESATVIKESSQGRLNIRCHTFVMNGMIYQTTMQDGRLYLNGFNVESKNWINTTEIKLSIRSAQLSGVVNIFGKICVTLNNEVKTIVRILDFAPSLKNCAIASIIDQYIDNNEAQTYLDRLLPRDIKRKYIRCFKWRKADSIDVQHAT